MRKNSNLHKLAYALEKRADFLEDAKNWIVDNPELAAGLLGGGLGAGAGALVPTEEGGGAGARVRNALIGALLGGGVGAGAGYLGKGKLQKSPPSDNGGKKEDTEKPRKTFFAEWGNDGQLHMTPTDEVKQEDIVKSLTSHNVKGNQGSDSTSDDEEGGNNFNIGGTSFPTNFMDAEDYSKEDKEKERQERLDAFFNRGMHMSPYSNQFFEDDRKATLNGTRHLEQLERERQLREAVQNITNLINKGKEKVNNIHGRDVARLFFPGLVPPKK